MTKLYIYGAVLSLVFFSGWKVHGWYTDSKHKDAMENMIEAHNEQRDKDLETFDKDIKKVKKSKIKYIKIREASKNVSKTPDNECTVGPEYKRVWNDAIPEDRASVTNTSHDTMRASFVNDNR